MPGTEEHHSFQWQFSAPSHCRLPGSASLTSRNRADEPLRCNACAWDRTTIAGRARKYSCRARPGRTSQQTSNGSIVCLPQPKGTLFCWRIGMLRREFITLLGGAATAWPIGVLAQKTPVVIGFLGGQAQAAPGDPQGRALRQGFLDHGLVEGRDCSRAPMR